MNASNIETLNKLQSILGPFEEPDVEISEENGVLILRVTASPLAEMIDTELEWNSDRQYKVENSHATLEGCKGPYVVRFEIY